MSADYRREAAWVALRERIAGKKRGDSITAAEIREATGSDWRKWRARLRTWAKHQGFVLAPVHNDGYRILLPHEHVDQAEQHRVKAMRQERKVVGALISTPANELDDRQLRRHEHAMVLAQRRYEQAQQHDRELRPRVISDRPPLRVLGGKTE